MPALSKQVRVRQLPLFQPAPRQGPSWDSMPPEIRQQIERLLAHMLREQLARSLRKDLPSTFVPDRATRRAPTRCRSIPVAAWFVGSSRHTRSRLTSVAALWPGAPLTPPPG